MRTERLSLSVAVMFVVLVAGASRAYDLDVTSSPNTGLVTTSSTGHGGTTDYQATDVDESTNITITAPATDGSGNPFARWKTYDEVNDVQYGFINIATLDYTMQAGDATVTAVYDNSTATRVLPSSGTYAAGTNFTVQIVIADTTDDSVLGYIVEDSYPAGWNTPNSMSNGGAFDSVNRSCKWVFMDGAPRNLQYTARPNSGANGPVSFSGHLITSVRQVDIGGDSSLSGPTTTTTQGPVTTTTTAASTTTSVETTTTTTEEEQGGRGDQTTTEEEEDAGLEPLHPADANTPAWRLTSDDLTAYAAAWKTGTLWSVAPVDIPMEYATWGGYLWKSGEEYHYVEGASPPFCWAPGASTSTSTTTTSSTTTSTTSTSTSTTTTVELPSSQYLVGWWKFDESSGATAADSSGKGNHGTVGGAYTWAAGRIDNGLRFDGGTTNVDCGADTSLDVGDGTDLSVTFWVRRELADDFQPIVEKRYSINSGFAGFTVDINADNHVYATFSDGTHTFTMTSSVSFIGFFDWRHVAVVFDENLAAGCKIYVEGIEDAGATQTGTLGNVGSMVDNTIVLLIGTNYDPGTDFFKGLLDDIRMYKCALTAPQVVTIICQTPTTTTTTLPNCNLWVAGYNNYGQLGLGHLLELHSFTNVQHPGLENIVQASAGLGGMCGTGTEHGGGHSFALTQDWEVWATGRNYQGELGLQDRTDRDAFECIADLSGEPHVSYISSGSWFTLALMSNGDVRGAGCTAAGEIGLASSLILSFTEVPSMDGVSAIAAGSAEANNGHGGFSLLLRSAYEVWATGNNKHGELGGLVPVLPLDSSYQFTFGKIGSANEDNVEISGGDMFSLVRKSDGTVWGTGRNVCGQLGHGNRDDCNQFLPSVGLGSVVPKSISAGGCHALLLATDGTVWATGDNECGQLGFDPEGTPYLTVFTQVPGLENIKRISAGGWHSLVVDEDGQVWAAGLNNHGQLGTGNTNDEHAFVPVPNLPPCEDVAAGAFHSIVIARTE